MRPDSPRDDEHQVNRTISPHYGFVKPSTRPRAPRSLRTYPLPHPPPDTALTAGPTLTRLGAHDHRDRVRAGGRVRSRKPSGGGSRSGEASRCRSRAKRRGRELPGGTVPARVGLIIPGHALEAGLAIRPKASTLLGWSPGTKLCSTCVERRVRATSLLHFRGRARGVPQPSLPEVICPALKLLAELVAGGDSDHPAAIAVRAVGARPPEPFR